MTSGRGPDPLSLADCDRAISIRFAAQAARHGGRVAVRDARRTLSYAELSRDVHRLARAIVEARGAGEEAIGVLVEPGAGLVTALLATIQAGKIAVPLDATFPAARTRFMLEDSGARLVIVAARPVAAPRVDAPVTGASPADVIPDGVALLALDAPAPRADSPEARPGPQSGAVILYTSGSSGQPKGVLYDHASFVHTAMTYCHALEIDSDDRIALVFTASAFGGIRDILAAVLNGAALLPFDLRGGGAEAFGHWLAAERITVLNIGVTAFRHVSRALPAAARFPSVRALRVGGEAITAQDVAAAERHFPAPGRLHLAFGTTETANPTEMVFPRGARYPERGAPTGYPVHGMHILILDEGGRPLPTGAEGEIAVRSRYFPPGYWRRPDLTARAYAHDPSGDGTRVYRTGDLGYVDAAGCLVHLRRLDAQVKIRGYRVDPAEVEAALLAEPGVAHAAVVPRERAPGDVRLVAYVAPAERPAGELRRALGDRLPAHLVASIVVALPALPRTPQGKIDRRALPDPDWSRGASAGPFVAPRTPIETALADLWAESLGVPRVGISDGFFDLGGNSLLAAQLAARVVEHFGLGLPIGQLLDVPTVADMAVRVLAALVERPTTPGSVSAGGAFEAGG